MQDQGKCTFWKKIKFREETKWYTGSWLLKLELKFGSQFLGKEKESISEWFTWLMKRKQKSFSGESTYSLYLD